MESPDLDLAVARGAAYYGWCDVPGHPDSRRSEQVLLSRHRRSHAGGSRTFRRRSKLCAWRLSAWRRAPKSAIAGREFVLVVGEPARFRFSGCRRIRRKTPSERVVEDWEGEIESITTVETALEGEAGSAMPVTLEVRVTEVGTLELWCAAERTANAGNWNSTYGRK